jgi:cytochrome c
MMLRCLVLMVALGFVALIASSYVRALAAVQTGPPQANGSVAQAGDATRGKLVFEKRCTGCHAMDADREGPRLRTVYGRKAASVEGFDYSKALLRSGITWTPEMLDQWLTDPDALLPGNNMSFATPKATDRRDLVAYFEQESERK